MKTHYQLIGVEASAGAEEIKRAFRKEIARYHPDKVQHLGREFQEIASVRAAELTAAYRILMDPAARQKYDEDLDARIVSASPASSTRPPAQAPATAAWADVHRAPPPVPEAFEQTRDTLSEVVKKAALARLQDAAIALCDATPVSVRGFDAAYACRANRGLFRKAEPAVRLLARLVSVVDAAAVADAWPFALKASAGDAMVCMMLMGQGLAPSTDLAGAVGEQRRRFRAPGPVVVPVDLRDWEALFPPETPAVVRAVVERLRQGHR